MKKPKHNFPRQPGSGNAAYIRAGTVWGLIAGTPPHGSARQGENNLPPARHRVGEEPIGSMSLTLLPAAARFIVAVALAARIPHRPGTAAGHNWDFNGESRKFCLFSHKFLLAFPV